MRTRDRYTENAKGQSKKHDLAILKVINLLGSRCFQMHLTREHHGRTSELLSSQLSEVGSPKGGCGQLKGCL
jgi:hypothetical protein